MSYVGFGRGFLTELLNLIGVVAATVLTINLAPALHSIIQPWLPYPAPIAKLVTFWGLFLTLWYVSRVLRLRIAEIIKWERFNWFVQGGGLLLGGIRGLWWAGFVLVIFTSSGYEFLVKSVEEKSVLSPGLLNAFRMSFNEASHRLPGALPRGASPVPPFKPATHGAESNP
jgi:uncharacterized membrane protein required for colicin V production